MLQTDFAPCGSKPEDNRKGSGDFILSPCANHGDHGAVFWVLVFLLSELLALSLVIGINGVWLAMPIAEILGLAVTFFYFRKYKKKYHYA